MIQRVKAEAVMGTGLRVGGTAQVENGSLQIPPPTGRPQGTRRGGYIRRKLRNWSRHGKVPGGRLKKGAYKKGGGGGGAEALIPNHELLTKRKLILTKVNYARDIT